MSIFMAELGPFHLVRFIGDLTIQDAVCFHENLNELLSGKDRYEYVLDLSKIGAVDAAGMSALISSAAAARGRGHRIYLYAPAPHVQKQMEEQEVTGLFPLIENEADLVSRLPD